MTSAIQTPEGQLFECRDCPARCCSAPWRYAITTEEKNRFQGEAWINERLAAQGVDFVEYSPGQFSLPWVERDRRLVCAFLDEDNFCSQHKRHGFSFLSLTCKVFPFEFIETEDGVISTALSQFCPSIRDNFGTPVADKVDSFFESAGRVAKKLALSQTVGNQTTLTQKQTLQVAAIWIQFLKEKKPLRETLIRMYALTEQISVQAQANTNASETDWPAWLETAITNTKAEEIPPKKLGKSVLANLTLIVATFGLTYPLRVLMGKKPSLKTRVLCYKNLLKLWTKRGECDLLNIQKSFQYEDAELVSPPTNEPAIEEQVRTYLITVIQRGNLFLVERDLSQALLDMALAFSLLLRYARYRAASEGRRTVSSLDISEGISTAELSVIVHANKGAQIKILATLMAIMASNRLSFEGLAGLETA